MACNNSPLLCSRTYNDVTHLGAHDSAFIRDSQQINAIAGDQFFNATLALSAGVRLLQAQVHVFNGALQLCHTSCGLLNVGPLDAWLALIGGWMDANPHEVVTILLVNSDHQGAAAFGRAFQQAGLSKYGYAPKGTSGWPTLQAMIAANTRLVTFIASIAADAAYPYLLPEFQHVFETPYMITNLAQFSNCSLDRPPSAGSASAALRAGLLPLMNHFAYAGVSSSIQIPNVSDIDITNSPDTAGTQFASSSASASAAGATGTASSTSPFSKDNAVSSSSVQGVSGTLGTQARLCTSQWGGVKPTFILVDFFNRGPAIATVDALNGLTTTVGRTISQDMLPVRSSAVSIRATANSRMLCWMSTFTVLYQLAMLLS